MLYKERGGVKRVRGGKGWGLSEKRMWKGGKK